MHRIMIRMAAVLLLLLLPPLALAGGLLGLIGTTEALPDPAEIIEAATKELQAENDELKQYRLPGHLI